MLGHLGYQLALARMSELIAEVSQHGFPPSRLWTEWVLNLDDNALSG